MRFTDCINITGESCKKFDGDKIYISTGAVNVDRIDSNQIEVVNYDTKPSRANLITDDKSILFAKMQGTKKVLLIEQELEKNLYSTGFFSVSPKKNILNKKCLYHLLGSQTFLSQKDKYCSGATQKAITLEGLNKIEITIPKLEEQDQIAKRLDSIKTIIESYEKELKRYDELVKARFIEMFGDLKSNSQCWPIVIFTECAKIDTNMIHDFEGYEGYPHIGIDSIEKETGRLSGYRTVAEDDVISGKYLFTENHIIYSKIRPNLNKVAMPDFVGVCSADAYPILAKNGVCNKEYLAYTMRSKYFLDYILAFSNRTNLPKVNKKQVESFELPLPPIELQNEFADFVNQVDKSKLVVQKSLEKTQQLFDSLMQEYFE